MDERSKHAPHVVIDLDDGLRVLGWNRRAEQVFQVAEPEALGRELGDVAPLVGAATWAGVLAADSEVPSVRALARPGEQLLLEAWSQVTRDAEGRPVGATIYGHDVTARVLAERRAALEVKLLDAIIKNVDISVWAIDRQGVFLYQDGKASLDLGLKPHTFVGQNVFQLFHDSPDLEPLREALAGEPRFVEGAETLGQHWQNWYVPLPGAGEGEATLAAVSMNVSEAKRRETDLQARIDLIRKQQEVIRELSTPIIEIWDGVITLPIVGLLDSVRTAEVMDSLLQAVGRLRARYAILDLTGVEVVDTATASHLIGMIQAIRLLGAEGILTGIQPMIAQTIVSLGVDLTRVAVYARLRDALVHCISNLDNRKPRA